jgi:hypothetical protein
MDLYQLYYRKKVFLWRMDKNYGEGHVHAQNILWEDI